MKAHGRAFTEATHNEDWLRRRQAYEDSLRRGRQRDRFSGMPEWEIFNPGNVSPAGIAREREKTVGIIKRKKPDPAPPQEMIHLPGAGERFRLPGAGERFRLPGTSGHAAHSEQAAQGMSRRMKGGLAAGGLALTAAGAYGLRRYLQGRKNQQSGLQKEALSPELKERAAREAERRSDAMTAHLQNTLAAGSIDRNVSDARMAGMFKDLHTITRAADRREDQARVFRTGKSRTRSSLSAPKTRQVESLLGVRPSASSVRAAETGAEKGLSRLAKGGLAAGGLALTGAGLYGVHRRRQQQAQG